MDVVDLDLLDLSESSPTGRVPRPSPALLQLIRDHGIIEPVVVRKKKNGRFEILANASTAIAAGRLEIHRVPVMVIDDLDDESAAALVADYYSKSIDPNPVEIAEAIKSRIKQLDKHGAVTQAAREFGVSRATAAHYLRLLRLPHSILDRLRTRQLSVGHAKALLMIDRSADQLSLARRALSEGLSVRETEKLASAVQQNECNRVDSTGSTERKSPDVIRLENRVSQRLGCQFTINEGQGTCTIDYYKDLKILDGVLENIGYRETDI